MFTTWMNGRLKKGALKTYSTQPTIVLAFFERHCGVKTKKPVVSCTLSVGNGWVLHGIYRLACLCVCVCVLAAIVSSGIMSSVSFFLLVEKKHG